jgi:hypothetical protein
MEQLHTFEMRDKIEVIIHLFRYNSDNYIKGVTMNFTCVSSKYEEEILREFREGIFERVQFIDRKKMKE